MTAFSGSSGLLSKSEEEPNFRPDTVLEHMLTETFLCRPTADNIVLTEHVVESDMFLSDHLLSVSLIHVRYGSKLPRHALNLNDLINTHCWH